jgi:hypothetical protein
MKQKSFRFCFIVAKSGSTTKHTDLVVDLVGNLAGDHVAKKLYYYSKIDLVGDNNEDLAGNLTENLAGDLVAKQNYTM